MSRKQKPRLDASWIDYDAKKIVQILQENNFETYLVGGCVRDLLVGKHPKDYDIATNATPNQIKRFIRGSNIIGKRFRLVLVRRGLKLFEVATFRRSLRPNEKMENIISGDNLFGTSEEDARRRDFTINSLFYDPTDDSLIDYCGGQADIEKRIVRIIGEPDKRLFEDPIRILRGLRLSFLINFSLEPALRQSMQTSAVYLPNTALPRRREEFLKLLRLKEPTLAFRKAHDLNVLKYCLPTIAGLYNDPDHGELFDSYLERIHEVLGTSPEPLELFAIFIFAYWRTMIEEDPLKRISVPEILQHPLLISLMRDELGMFKMEQAVIAQAIHLQSYLINYEIFKKRGEKRKLNFLQNPALTLALMFAQVDYSLNGEARLFWEQSVSKSRGEKHDSPNGR